MSDTGDRRVVVVGGGPAGLAAAASAARHGAETVVLEKQNEIGYPIHTSGASWITDMRRHRIPPHLYHPTSTLTFLSAGRDVSITYPEPLLCLLDVRGLYQYLAERAIEAGAQILLRHNVTGPLTRDGRVGGVAYKDHTGQPHELKAAVTIDASGYARKISTKAGVTQPFHRYGFGAEFDLVAPNFPQDAIYLIMGTAFAPNGYGWVGPRGNSRVRVGVGVIHPDTKADPREYLDALMAMPQLKDLFTSSSPVEYHTGLFPSEALAPALAADGLLVAGDSGAQGSTLLGEGIRYALDAGQLAGETAATAVINGDTSVRGLRRYDKQWRASFGRSLDIGYLINKRITGYTDEQWDSALDLIGRMDPKHVAAALHGDFTPGLLARIVARSPGLVATSGRKFISLLRSRLTS